MTKLRSFSILAALSVAHLSAQPPNPLNSLLNVYPQQSQFPGGTSAGDFEFFFTNQSGKAIAAWNLELTTYSARGPAVRPVSLDLLTTYAGASRVGPDNDARYFHMGPLQAGRQLSQLLNGTYAPDSLMLTKVTTIVFDDNTVLGDRAWARSIFDQHAGTAAELDAILAMLQGQPKTNLREQIRAWKQELLQKQRHIQATAGNTFALGFAIRTLEEVSRDSIGDAEVAKQFQEAVSYFSDTANDMRQHSRIAP